MKGQTKKNQKVNNNKNLLKVIKKLPRSRPSVSDIKNKEVKIDKKKTSKTRSISEAQNTKYLKIEKKPSHTANNSIELDYLNFTKIDIFKYDNSFDDDIFNPNYNLNGKINKSKITSVRYENQDISIISNKNINDNSTDRGVLKQKENLAETPSTICNYYDKSENSKKKKNLPEKSIMDKENIKKDLIKYFNEEGSIGETKNRKKGKGPNEEKKINKKMKIRSYSLTNKRNIDLNYFKENNNVKYNNIIINENNLFSKKGKEFPIKNEIPCGNNLMRNYLKSKLSFKKSAQTMPANIKSQLKAKNESKEEVNELISKVNGNYSNNNYIVNYSSNNINEKFNKNFSLSTNNKNNNTFTTNKINRCINLNFNDNNIIFPNNKKNKRPSQQKPINLCFDKIKYDSYFITPRAFTKLRKPNILTSTKSTKMKTPSFTKGLTHEIKSMSTTNSTNKLKNKGNFINNIEKNNNYNNSDFNSMRKILENNFENNKPLIKDINSNTDIKNNRQILIKVSTRNYTKSSSNLIPNNSKSKENIIINKKSSNDLHIYKEIDQNGKRTKSPNKKNNLLKISKTLTEHNVLNKMQETPKNYKGPKYEGVPFTTLAKQIYVCSSEKDNNVVKCDSNLKSKEKTKTEHLKCIFKPKTQSDFKIYKNIFGNDYSKKNVNNNKVNNDYGKDSHVKQKLLDRMNNATKNGWNYFFNRSKNQPNKKILDDGISECIKSPRKDVGINYFYKNENIISDGSENDREK